MITDHGWSITSVLLTGVQLTKRDLAVAVIPYLPLFAWYYVFSSMILEFVVGGYTKTFFIYNAYFNFLLSFSTVLGSFVIRRIAKTSVIYSWSILSTAGMILLVLAPADTLRLAIYLLLGLMFGIGIIAFFTFFWDLTVPEERGRIAGLMGFISLPVFPIILILARNLDFFATSALCIILSLTPLMMRPLNSNKEPRRKNGPKGSDPEARTVLLYLIPWAIFASINSTLAQTVSAHFLQRFSLSLILLEIVQVTGGGLGAIIGGVIADFFGRRASIALGLVLYGISSAVSGLTTRYEMVALSFVGSGLTWGILLTLFLFVVWGDLATSDTCSRRYSFGLAIFFLAAGAGALLKSELLQIPLSVASIASCLLIFASNVPVVQAPELLPANFREKIRLRLYIYRVMRRKPAYP